MFYLGLFVDQKLPRIAVKSLILHCNLGWLHGQKSTLSFGKNKCETFGPSLQIETPLIEPTCSACCISECNPSAHKRNRYGDRGSP